jgi:hypothetical protein
MKLRLRGNSLRLRLTRSEVARLGAGETVEEASEFSPEQIFRYGIQPGDELRTTFKSGQALVIVPAERIRQWASTDEVGIYGASGALDIAIEKDFRCLTRPEERFDPDVYPHPGEDLQECGADRTP